MALITASRLGLDFSPISPAGEVAFDGRHNSITIQIPILRGLFFHHAKFSIKAWCLYLLHDGDLEAANRCHFSPCIHGRRLDMALRSPGSLDAGSALSLKQE